VDLLPALPRIDALSQRGLITAAVYA